MEKFDIIDTIVRIKTATGKVVGTGFLVDDNYVLTCAHVIIDSWEGLDKKEMKELSLPVFIDFPDIDTKKTLTAKAIIVKNPSTEDDVGILKLIDTKPAEAKAAPLKTSSVLWGHKFRTSGFPEGFDNGVIAEGVIRGKIGRILQIEDDKVPGARIRQGFSGAPVWDEVLQGVVGMVSQENKEIQEKMAMAIPSNVIATVCPQLKVECADVQTEIIVEGTPSSSSKTETVPIVKPNEIEDSNYEEGISLLQIGNYDQAISSFEACLLNNPKNDKAWIGKGDCYRQIGEKARQNWKFDNLDQTYEKALTCYNNALKQNPQSIDAWMGKANSLVRIEPCRDVNLFSEIRNCYDNVLKINPHFFQAFCDKGYLYLREHNSGRQSNKEILIEAERNFDQALKIDENSTTCWFGKAEALELRYKYTGDKKVVVDAIACLDNALKIDPSDSESKNMRDALASSLKELTGNYESSPPQDQTPSTYQVSSPPQDLLSGRWIFPNGMFWDIIKQGSYYVIMEFIPNYGKDAEGTASINGNIVYVSMNRIDGVQFSANLVLNGKMLQGTCNFGGFLQPLITYRAG